MGLGEEVGELGPAGGLVEVGVDGGGWALGWEGEEAARFLEIDGERSTVGYQVLFGMYDRLEKLWGRLRADEFDILLKAKHEL